MIRRRIICFVTSFILTIVLLAITYIWQGPNRSGFLLPPLFCIGITMFIVITVSIDLIIHKQNTKENVYMLCMGIFGLTLVYSFILGLVDKTINRTVIIVVVEVSLFMFALFFALEIREERKKLN